MAANNDVSRIAGNIGALNALNSMNSINKQLALHQTRLASGKRINSAGDDPAGLTIATKMQARSEGLSTALANIGDAQNMLAVAEGGVSRISDILVQMRNKTLAASSDTMGTEERGAVVTQLTDFALQIDDVVSQTKWNGTALVWDGTGTQGNFQFQTGADSSDSDKLDFTQITDLTTTGLSLTVSLTSASTAANFTAYLDTIDAAISDVNSEMTRLGTSTARLTFKEDQATAAQANVEAAYNRIMNADMAKEQVSASKYSILQQTSTAMLAQANSAPQFLLSLFR